MQRRGRLKPCAGAFGFKDIRHLNRIAQMDVTVGGELADAIAIELAGHQRKTPETEDHGGHGQMKKRRQHQKMAGIISESVDKGLNHLRRRRVKSITTKSHESVGVISAPSVCLRSWSCYRPELRNYRTKV